jgi:hypothetical protein
MLRFLNIQWIHQDYHSAANICIALHDIGDAPPELLHPILRHTTPDQLKNIEDNAVVLLITLIRFLSNS